MKKVRISWPEAKPAPTTVPMKVAATGHAPVTGAGGLSLGWGGRVMAIIGMRMGGALKPPCSRSGRRPGGPAAGHRTRRAAAGAGAAPEPRPGPAPAGPAPVGVEA
ncbi:hypothetical protein JCM13210_17710 [Thermaerobacter litoralis]